MDKREDRDRRGSRRDPSQTKTGHSTDRRTSERRPSSRRSGRQTERRSQAERKQADQRANRTVLLRTLFLLAVFGILVFIPVFRELFRIQITQHELYREKATNQQTMDNAVMANRGVITDVNGKALARSATVYDVIISPKDFQAMLERWDKAFGDDPANARYPRPDMDDVAEGLAEILGADEDKILHYFQQNSYYEVAAKRVEKNVADEIRAFIVDNHLSNSIQLPPTSKRYYPYSTLASQVIGWVNPNLDNMGAYGMEALYDEQLAGQTGRVVTAKKGDGTEMKYSFQDYYDAMDGNNVELTLDATIQYYCERILAKGIEMFEVQNGGFAIAMDPRSGEIKAWANSPTYDLNDPWGITDPILNEYIAKVQADPNAKEDAYTEALIQSQNYQWRNKAINDTYEPGSTFKTVVLAAALEENVVNENDHFYCKGYLQVADRIIRCSKKPPGHGDQDLATAVANSCNPAFMMIGQKLGADRFYDYLEDFGFLEKTGIDMQGESMSVIWPREEFTAPNGITSLATASFGQRLKVTPIQLITAASAVVNGGHLMQPYVMKSITTSDGDVIMQNQPTQVRQVVSESTSERCRTILESVVDGGTGKRAYIPGYRIGGKTGSSETDEADHTIVSFLAFAPADDPQIILLLAYDNPKPTGPGSNFTSKGYYISGGNMAAMMAGELMGDILEYMGVERVYSAEEQAKIDTVVPNLISQTPQVAQESAEGNGFTVRFEGEGGSVTGQIPMGGAVIPRGSEVVLYLGVEKPTDKVPVPNIMGKTAAEAQAALAESGLYLKVAGSSSYMDASAVVAGQTIYAGTPVERGTVVECMFADNTLTD